MNKHNVPSHAVSIWTEGNDIKVCFDDAGQTHVVTLQSGFTQAPSEADAYAAVYRLKTSSSRMPELERSPSDLPLPAVAGWAVLRRILMNREQSRETPATIAQPASLTQWQVDKLVKEFRGQVKVVGRKREAPADISLSDLGL